MRAYPFISSRSLVFSVGLGLALAGSVGGMAGCSSPAPSGSGQGGAGGKGGRGGQAGSGGQSGSGGQAGDRGAAGAGGASDTGGSAGGSGGSGGAGGDVNPGTGGAPLDASDDDTAAPSGADGGAPATGTPSASAHSKVLTLDTTAAGANVMGDVAKYPVAVVLTAANFDFTQSKPNGDDLRFTTMDGTALPFAIELWDATAQIGAAWVKVDVKGNATQMIKMSWGDSAAAAAGDSNAVFDTKDGFLGVWHLSEAAGTTMGAYKDATASAANASGVALDATSTDVGRVGRGASLLNAKKQYIQVDGDKNALFDIYDKMTYSIWVKPKSHTIEYQAMFSKGETGFRIHFYGNPDWNGGKNITEICAEEIGGGDFCPVNHKGTDVAPGKWFFMTGVQDKPKATSYINGAMEATETDGSGWTSGAAKAVMIGNNASNLARAFDGVLDEARIYNVAKDINWIKLEYESQREGQKFLTFGTTQDK